MRSFGSAAAATADTNIAAHPAAKRAGALSAGEPTASISKALKENWITEIGNACGVSVSAAA
jgi:hypothetical protein